MCKAATAMGLAGCCAVVLAEQPRVQRRKPLAANVGVGHHAAELKKLGRALGIETVVVTEGK